MKNIINIFGANGSGKSTLGAKLAEKLNYKFMDIEDYYFEKSDVFYANPRSKDDVIKLLLADMETHKNFVFSACTGDYGEEIVSKFDLGIYLLAPLETRMDRIWERAVKKHGDRVLQGGDMFDNRQEFEAYARNRDLSVIDNWAKTLTCPILKLDGTKSIDELIEEIERNISL